MGGCALFTISSAPSFCFFLDPPPSLVDVRQTIAFFLGTIFSSEQPNETFLRFLGQKKNSPAYNTSKCLSRDLKAGLRTENTKYITNKTARRNLDSGLR